MKLSLELLILTEIIQGLLFYETNSLKCYECKSCPLSSEGSFETCPADSNSYCMTTILSAGEKQYYAKKCSSNCTESNNGNGLEVKCCSTDGCNKHSTTPQHLKSLKCYECDSCTGSNQGSLVTCPTGSNSFCMSTIASALGIKSVTKKCSNTCIESNSGAMLGSGLQTKCCSIDGCNKLNIAFKPKSEYLFLILHLLH